MIMDNTLHGRLPGVMSTRTGAYTRPAGSGIVETQPLSVTKERMAMRQEFKERIRQAQQAKISPPIIEYVDEFGNPVAPPQAQTQPQFQQPFIPQFQPQYVPPVMPVPQYTQQSLPVTSIVKPEIKEKKISAKSLLPLAAGIPLLLLALQ